jgi:hypothetical protein
MFEKLCSFFRKCFVANQEVAPTALEREPLPSQSMETVERKSAKKAEKPKTAAKKTAKKVVEIKKASAKKKTSTKSAGTKRAPKNKK